jgi:hypothetical protein
MKKIPTLFVRDFENDPSRVTREVTPGCEWVLDGEGEGSQKWDGTAVLIDASGHIWKRYTVRKGRPEPPHFLLRDEDPKTGKKFGWVPVTDDPVDKYLCAALDRQPNLPEGTYELCGPHIQGNPEGLEEDTLVPHGAPVIDPSGGSRTFDGIKAQLEKLDVEGIVYWRDGVPSAKIKKRDFGLKRKR